MKVRLAVVADVVLIIAGMAVLASYAAPIIRSATAKPPIDYKVGDRVQQKGRLRLDGTTFVLDTSSKCGYCTASMPLYAEMLRRGARLVAVTAEDVEVNRSYLAQHKVLPEAVLPIAETGLRFLGTPSLLCLDRAGTVRGAWAGKLSPKWGKGYSGADRGTG
jgi:hypothetical protein